jgi:hypothetical protein
VHIIFKSMETELSPDVEPFVGSLLSPPAAPIKERTQTEREPGCCTTYDQYIYIFARVTITSKPISFQPSDMVYRLASPAFRRPYNFELVGAFKAPGRAGFDSRYPKYFLCIFLIFLFL